MVPSCGENWQCAQKMIIALPLAMKFCSFLHPSARDLMPVLVIISHQEMSKCTRFGQPWASACMEMSVRAAHELTSKYWSLWQCIDRDRLVRSDIFLQYFKLSNSMLLQNCEKVARAESPTAWQPRRLSLRRKPPHLQSQKWISLTPESYSSVGWTEMEIYTSTDNYGRFLIYYLYISRSIVHGNIKGRKRIYTIVRKCPFNISMDN